MDEELKRKLAEITSKMKVLEMAEEDEETEHLEADKLLCEALTLLGCVDMVKSFENIHKWYA